MKRLGRLREHAHQEVIGPMKVKTGITIGMRTGERLAPVVHYGSRGPGLLAFLVVALIAAAVAFASTALP